MLPVELGGAFSQPDLALILACGIPHDLVAGTDRAHKNRSGRPEAHLTRGSGGGTQYDLFARTHGPEHRGGFSQADLALILACRIPYDLVARANGPEHRGGFAQTDLVLVLGGGITDHFIAYVNHRYLL